ncbi:MAG: Rpn family recombination-promoting nuclease/putative transposase [Acidaminococcaceae bacterium]|nr:Rpn family recombination-promoting nuclease/putative transposase [Acidaminococcaceae bacterium]
MKEFKEIDWDSMTFANNYVFLEVMNNKRRCQFLIEKVLHIPIKKVLHIAAERHTSSPRLSSKSIRLDVYVETLDGIVIDIEMQVTGKGSTVYKDKDDIQVARELPLRTRYYQSLIGMDMLRRGMDYPELRKSYVVFICTFDPYGKGLPVYHFTYRCREDDTLEMGDMTENIFLNAKAADKTEDKELSAFLRYVHSGLAQSAFTQEIDNATKRVKNDTKWRERIVTWEMDLRIMEKRFLEKGREEGREEGREKMAQILREKYGMPESEIEELKKEAAARETTREA